MPHRTDVADHRGGLGHWRVAAGDDVFRVLRSLVSDDSATARPRNKIVSGAFTDTILMPNVFINSKARSGNLYESNFNSNKSVLDIKK